MLRLLLISGILTVRLLAQKTLLSNSAELGDWEFIANPAASLASVCSLSDDGVLHVTGKPVGFLATKAGYKNYRLHAEWRWSEKAGNSGILIHVASGPKDRAWPVSLQVQLKQDCAGDILPMAGATFKEPLSTPSDAKTPALSRRQAGHDQPVGQWNTAIVTCRGDTVDVVINGVPQNHVSGCSLSEGPIAFQLEGTPFELRNVVLTPLP